MYDAFYQFKKTYLSFGCIHGYILETFSKTVAGRPWGCRVSFQIPSLPRKKSELLGEICAFWL